jgi:hypothetical protein
MRKIGMITAGLGSAVLIAMSTAAPAGAEAVAASPTSNAAKATSGAGLEQTRAYVRVTMNVRSDCVLSAPTVDAVYAGHYYYASDTAWDCNGTYWIGIWGAGSHYGFVPLSNVDWPR